MALSQRAAARFFAFWLNTRAKSKAWAFWAFAVAICLAAAPSAQAETKYTQFWYAPAGSGNTYTTGDPVAEICKKASIGLVQSIYYTKEEFVGTELVQGSKHRFNCVDDDGQKMYVGFYCERTRDDGSVAVLIDTVCPNVAPAPMCNAGMAPIGGNKGGTAATGGAEDSSGNPTYHRDGSKIETANDWISPKDPRFVLQRFYTSRDTISELLLANTREAGLGSFGSVWRLGFDTFVKNTSSDGFYIFAPDGQVIFLPLPAVNGVFSSRNGWPHRARAVVSTPFGNRHLVEDGGGKKYYFGTGAYNRGVNEIVWPDGYKITIARDANHNGILSITDNKGQRAVFTRSFDAAPGSELPLTTQIRIDTDYDGVTFDPQLRLDYTYAVNTYQVRFPKITSITETDLRTNTSRILHSYEYLSDTEVFPPALTKTYDGRLDENGQPFAYGTFTYSGRMGRVASTTHPGGADFFRFASTSAPNGASELSSLTVTCPTGYEKTFSYTGDPNKRRLTGYSGTDISNGSAQTRSYNFTTIGGGAEGYPYEKLERNGSRTRFSRDSLGRILTKTEDADGPAPRVTSYTWGASLRLPLTRSSADLKESFTYDANGLLTSQTREDIKPQSPSFGQSRITTYTYTTLASGLKVLTSLDGPGLASEGVQDITRYTYTSQGLLSSVTDPNGLVTRVLARDVTGLPSQVEEPDGDLWSFAYDHRGRVVSAALAAPGQTPAPSLFTYDIIGQLLSYTNPQGKTWSFTYDGARRLTKITSPSGEETRLSYDPAGNVIRRAYAGATGAETFFEDYTFDQLSRLTKTLGAEGQEWRFTHDAEDNLTAITDPLTHVTGQAFDGLSRVTAIVDRENFTTELDHNDAGQVTLFRDPRAIETTFTHNGFGEVVAEVSADRGTRSYSYDARGLVISFTDPRGVSSNYSYDHGGRLLAITYPPGTLAGVAFTYDAPRLQAAPGANRGHMAEITDAVGQTLLAHETTASGARVTVEAHYPGGRIYTLTEESDFEGNLTRLRYPSGREVLYTYDDDGRVSAVTLKDGATLTPLLSGLTYRPFGPLAGASFGDGSLQTRAYDESYRLTGVLDLQGATPLRDLSYAYEARDNLAALTDALAPGQSESFTYTPRESLASATGPYGDLAFAYDGVGNRLSLARGTESETYAYPAGNNRLASITPTNGTARSFTYDAAGHVIADSRGAGFAYEYDAAGRLARVTLNGVLQAEYRYDFAGRQALRDLAATGTQIQSVFGADGTRLAEYEGGSGALLREYIWLGLTPIAVIENGQVYLIRADHIGRPSFATDLSGAVVWEASYDPFGAMVVSSGPVPDLRFPGQWFQAESGLHQNWMRDYDPTTGRYLEPDPLGLVDGASVYGYVGQNPGRYVDPRGLFTLRDAWHSLAGKDGYVHPREYFPPDKVFDEWLWLEEQNQAWHDELPNCPCELSDASGPKWQAPRFFPNGVPFHAPGTYDSRSRPTPGGHASQCIYDANGRLIRTPPAAGSADYSAFEGYFSEVLSGGSHYFHDVEPFGLAEKLGRIPDYYDVRPTTP